MMQAMDQRAIGEAMDGASGGSAEGVMAGAIGGSARNSDGWCERLIREL
jgi:hypothetical protein